MGIEMRFEWRSQATQETKLLAAAVKQNIGEHRLVLSELTSARPPAATESVHALNRSRTADLYFGVVALSQSSTVFSSGEGPTRLTARGSYFFFCSSLRTARMR